MKNNIKNKNNQMVNNQLYNWNQVISRFF